MNWNWIHIYQKSFKLIKQALSADLVVRPLDYESPDLILFVTNTSLISKGA